MITKQRIGLSPHDAARSDVLIDLPSFSPITHGMCQLDVQWDGDKVIAATPILGSMHRGAEKLFESRDYRQILGLANRHEWLSAFSGEVGIAQLIERELGIDVPLKARWLRTLLLETYRITSHLAFLAGFPWQDDNLTQRLRLLREPIVLHLRSYAGSRMHPMLTQIGGLTHAPASTWLTELAAIVAKTQTDLADLQAVLESELAKFLEVGILTQAAAIEHAVSGPVARASGVAIDLRPTNQMLTYHLLENYHSPTSAGGDITARMQQLVTEVEISSLMVQECISACAEQLGGEINVLIPKVLRVPEGEYEHSIETPLGIASWLLISRGDKYPYRLKLRPASLHTLLAISAVLPGSTEQLLAPIVASMPFLSGDTDR